MKIYKMFTIYLLNKISDNFSGNLKVVFPDQTAFYLGKKSCNYCIYIKSYLFLFRILFQGISSIGYSYYKGEWETNNLSYVIRLGLTNIKLIGKLKYNKYNYLQFKKLLFLQASNSISKSKKQISYHYDLGNNFYKCWLDKSMTYSSAIFKNRNLSLEKAQINKYKSLIDLANIKKSNTVLEIGCGWGGFVNYVSKTIGSKITGITISKNQYTYAKKLNQQNANIKFLDYRKINNVYDKIISIEMFEAVGKKNWNDFFKILDKSLKNQGLAALQIITINEKLYESYEKNKDFIQKYIFPGGMLPTKSIIHSLANRNNLYVSKEKSLRKDYAITLNLWRKNFINKWSIVQKMGFKNDFKRLWEYYLIYCEEGFKAGTINVHQFLLKKKI